MHQSSEEMATPTPLPPKTFKTPQEAWLYIEEIYRTHTEFLQNRFYDVLQGTPPRQRIRATYPYLRIKTASHERLDSRLSYGFVSGPGEHETTITRPDLYKSYLIHQMELLVENHDCALEVGPSDLPIPVHFAFPSGINVEGLAIEHENRPLRDLFDVPDLAVMDDCIVNGTYKHDSKTPKPLALFNAPRLDYSLLRLRHYTATDCHHFQHFVLFTNYQFYIDEFCRFARDAMKNGSPDYDAFIEPGNVITRNVRCGGTGEPEGKAPARLPQMPAYHLKRPKHQGITIVNIGVGPSNAKTITDHVAVLRPHAWLMLGHCAGLRNTQSLGDYVLAHGYVREDHVLDNDLPTWVPVPALAEIQIALEEAVAEITELKGYELKKVMRTGTVATIDDRNWELRDYQEPFERFSQSRAIALDMESATIAANGFRFRVPYGTLLCVSDKPLHGELKLPGMASDFYTRQVSQHLAIGIRALEKLNGLKPERLHSRKLRNFSEVAFR